MCEHPHQLGFRRRGRAARARSRPHRQEKPRVHCTRCATECSGLWRTLQARLSRSPIAARALHAFSLCATECHLSRAYADRAGEASGRSRRRGFGPIAPTGCHPCYNVASWCLHTSVQAPSLAGGLPNTGGFGRSGLIVAARRLAAQGQGAMS